MNKDKRRQASCVPTVGCELRQLAQNDCLPSRMAPSMPKEWQAVGLHDKGAQNMSSERD